VVATALITDADLVARCRGGDEEAWRMLVERYARYVHAIAVRVYRLDGADAEDVFQEVFARTYEHLDRLRDDAAIRPWLAQLTRRLATDRLRAGARESKGEAAPPEEVEDALARLDEALTVRAALERLADPCREVLDRFFCRDESYATIGAALDIPPGTIASRISRCLERLRVELGEDRAA
jgi:RNA polymerase sigma-70 factor (ECF subfamily)